MFVLPDNIAYQSMCQNAVCNLLQEAFSVFQRYHPGYADWDAPWTGPWNDTTEAYALLIAVTLTGIDTILTLDTDESDELSVTTSGDLTTAVILSTLGRGMRWKHCHNLWSIMRQLTLL